MELFMPDEDFWRSLHEIVTERMEIDRKAIESTNNAKVSDFIDGECAGCGRGYYTDYLMPNFQNHEQGEPIEELCIECYLKQSR